MRTRLWPLVGGVVCLCACVETPPPEAESELAEPAAAAELDRAVAPEDELPRGACDEVPEGMRRVRVPLNHPLEHLERGDLVDVMFVAELRGAAIQREDKVAMSLIAGAQVACAREQAIELLVLPAEASLLAASKAHGVFYAVERARGDELQDDGRDVQLNRLMENYVSHWSEWPGDARQPIKLHAPRGVAYGLEKLTDHAPGAVRFTLPLAGARHARPGQRVDVLLSAQVPSLARGSAQMEPAGIVFAQMAKVEGAGDASVSLLVTRELAKALAVADGAGAWSLSLRADGDTELVDYQDVRLKEHLRVLEVVQKERSRLP